MKNNDERLEAYKICKTRGHEPSGIVLTSNPPWQVCKHCETHYQYSKPTLIESNVPKLKETKDGNTN